MAPSHAEGFCGPAIRLILLPPVSIWSEAGLENHLDKPAIILRSFACYPIPNLLGIRAYANLLVDKYGKEEEDAGLARMGGTTVVSEGLEADAAKSPS